MILIRLAGLFFAFVQITLFLRLLLPFVEVPKALAEYVPTLMEITDLWLSPVVAVVERFELGDLAQGAVGRPVSGDPLAPAEWALRVLLLQPLLQVLLQSSRRDFLTGTA